MAPEPAVGPDRGAGERRLIDWIEDDSYLMPLRLDNALADFDIIMGMYQSIIHDKTISFPLQEEADILNKIREKLK